MSNAAAAMMPPGGWHSLLRWISLRLAVYVAAALGSAVLFFIGATIYALLVPRAAASPPTIPLNILRTAPVVQPPPASPGQPQELIAQDTAAPSVTASSVFGLHLYGPGDEQIGDVSDIIFDRRGNIQAVVVGLAGYHWST